jgi:hypothetical protein
VFRGDRVVRLSFDRDREAAVEAIRRTDEP